MCFSVFSVFFTLNGLICVELLQAFSLPFDWVSLTLLLYNTAVLGAATLFHFPAPLLLKQANLIAVGVGTAFTFTFVPEWTSWTLLVAMALYDIAAGGCTGQVQGVQAMGMKGSLCCTAPRGKGSRDMWGT